MKSTLPCVWSRFAHLIASRSKLRANWQRQRARSRFLRVEGLEDRRLLARYVDDPTGFTITTDQGAPGLDTGDTVTWDPGPGSAHSPTPVTGLIFGTSAFTSIQPAVDAAAPGEEIKVGSGTFAETVDVTKQLFLLGNQVDVDAQSGRVGSPETIVTGTGATPAGGTPFSLTASDVELNGFTIEGNTNANAFGFGILLGAGTSGSEVRNNIVQNNIAGLSLANANVANQTIIEQNLFRNNNNPGPVSGTAIYTDQFNAGGALNNVLINNNTFLSNNNVAVLIGTTNAGSPATGITISSNIMTGNGNAVLLFNTLNSSVSSNEIRSSLGSQVLIGGGVNGLTVNNNFIENGAVRGIRIGDFGGGGTNQNVTINRNSISGNGAAGLEIDSAAGAYTGTLNAELNWWGSPTGPTIASNPGGTGEEIVDPNSQVDYTPFLTNGTDTQPGVRGFQPVISEVSITKADAPDPVTPGATLTYTIVVSNTGPDAQDNAVVADTFPAELTNVTFTSVAAGGATGNTAAGMGNINDTVDLPVGSSITYTVMGTVAPSATGTITNTATITPQTGTNETNTADNSATATTTVEPEGLQECEVETLNLPGAEGSVTLEDVDPDSPAENVLIVTGTSGNDVILIEPQPKSKGVFRVVRNNRVILTFASRDVNNIVVFALAGNDKVVVNGSMTQDAKLFGDEGNDQLFSGRGHDGLDGGAGNDKLFGGAGHDVLCGEDGNDFLYGQGGNDSLGGEAGNDQLYGEAGNDLIQGNEGNDKAFGGSGNDEVFGQEGNDTLTGDNGNDIVVGGDGNDKIVGGAGRDILIGGDGVDQLFGSGQDDILVGGSTVHDNDQEALEAILSEWTAPRSYVARVNNIRFGGGNNGAFTLDDTTVIDDGLADILWGQAGQDWFLVGSNDKLKDRANNELVN